MRDNGFNEKDVLTTGEVAKICNVASRTVSKWFDSGQLEGYRIPGSKDRRIPVANLLTFMKAHNIPMDGLMSGRPRILVVDADDQIGSTLQRVLTDEADFDVHTTSSLFQAGMECERFRPHVVLSSSPAPPARALPPPFLTNDSCVMVCRWLLRCHGFAPSEDRVSRPDWSACSAACGPLASRTLV